MARITWKENQVLSVETRPGHYALIQMVMEPYVVVFNLFNTNNQWKDADLQNAPVLFVHAVTKQFLKNSTIEKVDVKPAVIKEFPTTWIKPTADSRKVTVYKGTPDERTFIIIGQGGTLVQKDVTKNGLQEDRTEKAIAVGDDATIDKYELTSLAIYAEFNERLYLCSEEGKNVDPLKDLIFDRPIPEKYKRYVEIIAS